MSDTDEMEHEITRNLDNIARRKVNLQKEWNEILSKVESNSSSNIDVDPLQHLSLLRCLTRHQTSYEALASGVDKMKNQVLDCGSLADRVFSSVSELTMVQHRVERTLKLIDDALSLQECRILLGQAIESRDIQTACTLVDKFRSIDNVMSSKSDEYVQLCQHEAALDSIILAEVDSICASNSPPGLIHMLLSFSHKTGSSQPNASLFNKIIGITDRYCDSKLVWSEQNVVEMSQSQYPHHDSLSNQINDAVNILREFLPSFISKFANEFGDVSLIDAISDKMEKQIDKILTSFIQKYKLEAFVQAISKFEADLIGSRPSSSPERYRKSNKQFHERMAATGAEFASLMSQYYTFSSINNKIGCMLSEMALIVQDCDRYHEYIRKLVNSARRHERVTRTAAPALLQGFNTMHQLSNMMMGNEIVFERCWLCCQYNLYEDKQKSSIFDLLAQQSVNSDLNDDILTAPLDMLFYGFGASLSRVSSFNHAQALCSISIHMVQIVEVLCDAINLVIVRKLAMETVCEFFQRSDCCMAMDVSDLYKFGSESLSQVDSAQLSQFFSKGDQKSPSSSIIMINLTPQLLRLMQPEVASVDVGSSLQQMSRGFDMFRSSNPWFSPFSKHSAVGQQAIQTDDAESVPLWSLTACFEQISAFSRSQSQNSRTPSKPASKSSSLEAQPKLMRSPLKLLELGHKLIKFTTRLTQEINDALRTCSEASVSFSDLVSNASQRCDQLVDDVSHSFLDQVNFLSQFIHTCVCQVITESLNPSSVDPSTINASRLEWRRIMDGFSFELRDEQLSRHSAYTSLPFLISSRIQAISIVILDGVGCVAELSKNESHCPRFRLIEAITLACAESFEKFIMKTKFRLCGALVMEECIRSTSQFLSFVAGRLNGANDSCCNRQSMASNIRSKFSRLREIMAILTSEARPSIDQAGYVDVASLRVDFED